MMRIIWSILGYSKVLSTAIEIHSYGQCCILNMAVSYTGHTYFLLSPLSYELGPYHTRCRSATNINGSFVEPIPSHRPFAIYIWTWTSNDMALSTCYRFRIWMKKKIYVSNSPCTVVSIHVHRYYLCVQVCLQWCISTYVLSIDPSCLKLCLIISSIFPARLKFSSSLLSLHDK
jgi:hypothetical protein